MVRKSSKLGSTFKGDIFQLWKGIEIMTNWLNQENSENGIAITQEWEDYQPLDDIVIEFKDRVEFIQVKHDDSMLGDYYSFDDLFNEKEKGISLTYLFSGYKKIKSDFGKNVSIVILTGKRPTPELNNSIISGGKFSSDIMNLSNHKKLGELKVKIIDFCKNLDEDENLIMDFLRNITFRHETSDAEDLKRKIKEMIIPPKFIDVLESEMIKSFESPSDKKLKVFYQTMKKHQEYLLKHPTDTSAKTISQNINDIPVCVIKSYDPISTKTIKSEFCLDLYEDVKEQEDKIDWDEIYNKIYKIKTEANEKNIKKITIHPEAHISIGFLLGYVLRESAGFTLFVKQRDEIWTINPKVSDFRFNWKIEKSVLDKESENDLIVLINVGTNDIKKPFNNYLEENSINHSIIIEFSFPEWIESKSISSLVIQLYNELKLIRVTYKINIIHIFASIPIGLAIFLGYMSNILIPIQLYEFNKSSKKYYKSKLVN